MASSSHELLLEYIGRDDGASALAERIAQHIRDIPERHTTEINVESGDAQAELDALQLRILALKDAIIEGKFDGSEALAEAEAIKTELARIWEGADTRELELDAAGFFAEVDAAKAYLKTIPDEHVTIEVDTDRSLTSRLSQIGSAIKSAFSAFSGGGGGGTSGPLSALSGLLDKSTVSLGFFTTTAKAGGAILLGLVPIITSLIAVLGALVAGLVAAAAALGTLAVAAAAVAIPIAAIAIGAITRYKSMADSIDKAKQATDALKQAEEQHADAVRNVEAAERSVRQAEDGLVEARREAAEQIRNDLRTAYDDVRQAGVQLASAQAQELSAQQALTDAREEATRALVDQRLAAEGAALSETRAKIALNEAERNLRRVQGDPLATEKELREAKLAVREAELGLETAQVNRQRTQEDLNEAEKKGVEGSDQVVAAKQAIADAEAQVTDARTAYADATRKLNDAESATVRQSDSVVAARRAVVTANRGLNESQRQLARSSADLAEKQKAANQALAEADKATPAFFALRNAIDDVKQAFGQMVGAGVDRIFAGVSNALKTISPLLRQLRGAFAQLGGAIGRAFQRIAAEFASPAWARFFNFLIDAATSSIGPITGAFIGLLRILRNLAQSAMPFFIAALRSISGEFRKVGKATENGINLAPLFEQLGTYLEVFKQLGRVIINFIGAVLPASKELGDGLAETFEGFADWLASTEGKNSLADFFEVAIPLIDKAAEVVGKVIVAFFQLGELAAPVLLPILEAVGTVLDVINFLLGLLNKIPVPFRRFIGLILSVVGGLGKLKIGVLAVRVVLGVLVAVADRVIAVLGKAGGAVRWLIGRFGDLIAFLTGLPARVFGLAKGIVTGILNGIGTIGGRILGFFAGKFNAAIDFIRGVPGRIFGLVSRIPGMILAALAGLGGRIVGAFIGAFHAVTSFVASIPDRMFELGKDIMQGLIDGVLELAPDFLDTLKDIATKPFDIVKDKLGIGSPSKVMHELGVWTTKGFAQGLASALGDVQLASAGLAGIPTAGAGRRRGDGSRVGVGEMHNHFTVAGGGSPDPDAAISAISLALRRKGLSLE